MSKQDVQPKFKTLIFLGSAAFIHLVAFTFAKQRYQEWTYQLGTWVALGMLGYTLLLFRNYYRAALAQLQILNHLEALETKKEESIREKN